MERKILGGRLYWIFMVGMSALNFLVSLLIAGDPPSASGLSAIDEEEEPLDENWDYERRDEV